MRKGKEQKKRKEEEEQVRMKMKTRMTKKKELAGIARGEPPVMMEEKKQVPSKRAKAKVGWQCSCCC